MSKTSSIAPDDYKTPPFPGLYSFQTAFTEPIYLYHSRDIWRFTLFWTIITFEGFYLAASGYAVVVQWRNWRMMCIAPLLYMFVAGIQAVLAGSVVGLILGAIYRAGDLKMSTWIPFIWALINVLVLILSSFSMQGGL